MTREDGLNVFFVLESESGWMDGMGFDGYSQEGPFKKKKGALVFVGTWKGWIGSVDVTLCLFDKRQLSISSFSRSINQTSKE